ncbi:ABC transporter permease [Rhodococcus sp. G-MC3]|uniref:ABC transporter permease n=1 Tax=Rhodococcus sp. G-MC3 TaxID=3046209 RepID=UPI0024BBE00C|nr:ABC transporter permease [Rhodococcus sp. G-MC3]MDJ0394621.1 ABC transporter permease [Rhodococcus sp. G-MC3]
MTGTLGLIRLYLRKDRVVLPLWVLVIGLVPLLYAVSFRGLYPAATDRETFFEATARTPAELAMVGPIFGSDLGALVTWRAGILLTLAPLAAILTVVRHTRAEEDAGRTELMGSTAVGRRAALSAAILVAVGGVASTAVIASVSLLATGFAVLGSLAFGLGIAAVGAVFAGFAAVAAQIASGARLARGFALSVLALAFAARAVGDAGSGTLSWLSPIGWSAQLRPFADERWWVLLVPLVATALTVTAAFVLAGERDLGSGLVAERRGPATASASLGGVFGLAWRGHRGSLVAWTVGLGSIALVLGSAADGVGGQLGSSAAITDALDKFGGTSLVQSFLATAISILGIGAAAYSISSILRAHTEEDESIAESVLAGSVGRARWLSSHLVFAVFGPVVVMFVVGLAAGIAYGVAVGDVGSALPTVLGAALVQLPAIWVLTAAGTLLFGVAPRYSSAAWALLVGCVLLGQVGSVVGLPQFWLDLSPFTHLPHLPGGQVTTRPLVWLIVLAAVTGVLGTFAFRMRDLRS